MIEVKRFVFGPFDENTYLLVDPESKEAVIVDPGMWNDADLQRMDQYIESEGYKLTQIVNTHLHIDHCIADAYVRDRYGIKVKASAAAAPLGASLPEQARRFGVRANVAPVAADIDLKDGDTVNVGRYSLRVIEVPGHSLGGLALYCAEGGFVLTGDSLFQGSIGRTDLPGGSMSQLVNAVKTRLLTLPPDTLVLPGHGPATSVGAEKASNMYLR